MSCKCIWDAMIGLTMCPLHKAAPELLEHLKDMVRRFEGCLIVNGADKEFARESTVHARAAIAKAGEKGEG